MTDTASEPAPPTTATDTDTWADQLEQIRARYKHVREPILVALHILQHNPDISLEDAKALAVLRGVRITAASVAAAKRLLSRQEGAQGDTAPDRPAAKDTSGPAAKRRERRPRAPQAGVDAEALIRGVVEKLEAKGNAEAERLRGEIRKAIAVLQAAIG